jgi:hypothetical protein
VAIDLDAPEGDLADFEAKVDEALAAYAKLPEGARGALAKEKAKLDEVKLKIGQVNSAQGFLKGSYAAVLDKQADKAAGEDITIEEVIELLPELEIAEVAELLPVLEEAIKEYEALDEPVKVVLKSKGKDHGALLGSLKAKADEIIAAAEPVIVTISFESHGGTAVTAIEGKLGTAVNAPAEPTRNDGYSFTGWFDAETDGVLYTWPYTLAADLTMHAQWQDNTEPPPVQYTITFDSHEGSPVPNAVTANEGTKVNAPADPAKTGGYRFLGWFSEAKGGTEYTDWPHTLTADVTMHAQWVKQWTLSFDGHGGLPVPAAVTADEGETVPKPGSDPKRAGYKFLGWFSAEKDGTEYTVWPHTLTADVTMHAQWEADAVPPPVQYTITFNSHEGSVVEAVTRAAGTAVKKPADPTRTGGYRFLGWFPTASGGTAYTWDHTLTGDVTMHAQWIQQFTITFESHGGLPVPAAVTGDKGAKVPIPTEPARTDGYRFLGWFPAASGGTAYAWPYTLTGDVTMHAQWMQQFTVTFNSHGGSPVPEAVTEDTGTKVNAPAEPKRANYKFQGWWTAASSGTKYTWPYELTGNIEMHAQWTPEVTFGVGLVDITDEDGGILDQSKTITIYKDSNHGETSFTATVAGGYTVVQWYLNGGPLGNQGEQKPMTINAAAYAVGNYYLVVSVEKDDAYYSTSINFTVAD